jgi:hypothetical protein
LDLGTHVRLDSRGRDQLANLFLNAGLVVGVEPGRRYHGHTNYEDGVATE